MTLCILQEKIVILTCIAMEFGTLPFEQVTDALQTYQ